MFANDWDDAGENDGYLPFEERGWVRRMREREEARERFDRAFPDFFERIGRAVAQERLELAIKLLTEELDGDSNAR